MEWVKGVSTLGTLATLATFILVPECGNGPLAVHWLIRETETPPGPG